MYLSILWHFHQPIYKMPKSQEYILPWVNFHVKNYYQLARLVEEAEFPCTFNFVPCLLEQLEDYARGKAYDPYQLAVEKSPDHLTPGEIELFKIFASANASPSQIQLQTLRSFFSPLDELEGDKDELLSLQKEIQRNLIPFYKKLWEEGKIELTTSPYYHPLLPLVFDLKSAQSETLTSISFAHPEDGGEQLKLGREYFKNIFGNYSRGLWPPEGGISQDVVRSIFQNGFSFAVTDENILWKSLTPAHKPQDLYFPYLCENVAIFFRDRELSDLLSFEYQRWDEKVAVSDFLRRCEEKKRGCPENSILVLALDGENPWASYRQNGVPFLREFFTRLKQKEGIFPIFLQDYLARHKTRKEITLTSGTWLGNFSKWVGSAAKNKAWETLARGRELCGALNELYIAESSDWFWWFGEKNTEEFGHLFRSYIEEAYRIRGMDLR